MNKDKKKNSVPDAPELSPALPGVPGRSRAHFSRTDRMCGVCQDGRTNNHKFCKTVFL